VRLIAKKPPPPTVTATQRAPTTNLERKATARTAFDQLGKTEVRRQLAEEQRHLCVFCMRRIDPNGVDDHGNALTIIAHRIPLSSESTRALDWNNLFGSCDGGQRSGGHHRTCDFAQGDTALSVDPTQRRWIATLRYERRNGRKGLFLTSDDPEVRRDVEATLRLNDGDLPAAREAAWDAFRARSRKRFPKGPYGMPAHKELYAEESRTHGTKLPEWYGVIEKKLGVF